MNTRAGKGEYILQTHSTKFLWRFNGGGCTPLTPLWVRHCARHTAIHRHWDWTEGTLMRRESCSVLYRLRVLIYTLTHVCMIFMMPSCIVSCIAYIRAFCRFMFFMLSRLWLKRACHLLHDRHIAGVSWRPHPNPLVFLSSHHSFSMAVFLESHNRRGRENCQQ